jgi:hypothetical protein
MCCSVNDVLVTLHTTLPIDPTQVVASRINTVAAGKGRGVGERVTVEDFSKEPTESRYRPMTPL